MLVVVNSTMGSSLPSNAIPVISDYFHITSSYAKVLPISTYLVGYILGPLLFGPLSETYGRRFIMISSFVAFTLFTMACAVAPTWESFLFFRFATGVNASSPIAVIGGVYADIYSNPVSRGRAMAVFIGVSQPQKVGSKANIVRELVSVLLSHLSSRVTCHQLWDGDGFSGLD